MKFSEILFGGGGKLLFDMTSSFGFTALSPN